MRLGVARCHAQLLMPAVGERCERPVELATQRRDGLGQRIGEIPILSPPKPMAGHDDAGTKQRIVRVPARDVLAFGPGEETPDRGIALSIEVARQTLPIKSLHPLHDTGRHRPRPAPAGGRQLAVLHSGIHGLDSSLRSARLRSMPQR